MSCKGTGVEEGGKAMVQITGKSEGKQIFPLLDRRWFSFHALYFSSSSKMANRVWDLCKSTFLDVYLPRLTFHTLLSSGQYYWKCVVWFRPLGRCLLHFSHASISLWVRKRREGRTACVLNSYFSPFFFSSLISAHQIFLAQHQMKVQHGLNGCVEIQQWRFIITSLGCS